MGPLNRLRNSSTNKTSTLASARVLIFFLSLTFLLSALSCRTDSEQQRLRPRQLRDVPARRLAFSFQADVSAPPNLPADEATRIPAIQKDFDTRRQDDALLRTVASPDGLRALALYGTVDEPTTTFRIDLYSTDGTFIRNVTPPSLAVVFQDSVAWSRDSNLIALVGRRSASAAAAQASPTPLEPEDILPTGTPLPTPTPAPLFAPLDVFNTEQVYICDRDGYALRPLTNRDGLIYFGLSWAPDSHALVALACKESEWDAREKAFKTPAGRPRLIMPDGSERLLDDELADAPPVWSPDSSKVAASFGVDIGVYDALGKTPTQARISLRERLLTASAEFDAKSAGKKKADESANKPVTQSDAPVSFNPIVRLEWPTDDRLYAETAYISVRSELIKTFGRWHLVTLSAQAAVLGR
jgi:hypothetical protein